MSYQVLARKEDKELQNIIYKLLKIKDGDKLFLNLEDDAVVIKKFDNKAPISCKRLKPEEIGERLSEAISTVENGNVLSEQEVWSKLKELRLS